MERDVVVLAVKRPGWLGGCACGGAWGLAEVEETVYGEAADAGAGVASWGWAWAGCEHVGLLPRPLLCQVSGCEERHDMCGRRSSLCG